MALRQLFDQFNVLSLAMKLGLGLALIAIILLVAGGTRSCVSGSYEKREAKAVEEREVLFAERKQLQLEKAQLKGQIAELEAVNEALTQAAVTKRADTVETIKEIQAIEQAHETRKEQLGDSTDTDEQLRATLCERLCPRGYKLDCCPKR